LPTPYPVTPQIKGAIKAMQGVVMVEEVWHACAAKRADPPGGIFLRRGFRNRFPILFAKISSGGGHNCPAIVTGGQTAPLLSSRGSTEPAAADLGGGHGQHDPRDVVGGDIDRAQVQA
jgi:hypothetical protein